MAKCLINSKALMERTVYPCFSIKQQSEEGAVDARVAQVPPLAPLALLAYRSLLSPPLQR
jgi:hypothetical protein